MVNCVSHLLKKIDIFGQPVNLTIDQASQAKTVIGGLMTTLSLIGILIFSIFSAEDFYLQLNPTVTKTTYSHNKAFNFTLNQSSFPFALNYENPNINRSQIYFKGYYYIFDNILGDYTKNISLSFRNCKVDDFPMINSTVFYESINVTSFCIDNLNFELFGSFVDIQNGYLSIDLMACDANNGTIIPGCNSTYLVDELKKGYMMSLRMINIGVEPMNLSHPFNYFVENIYTLPAYRYKKIITMNIKKEIVETDDGWLMKHEYDESAWSYDSHYSDFRDRQTSELVNFRILPSNKEVVTKRVYQKIQNAIADIGGILSVVTSLMPMITYIFSVTKMNEIILNKIYDYDFSTPVKLSIELSNMGGGNLSQNQNYNNLTTNKITSGDLSNISGIKDNNNSMVDNSQSNRKRLNENKVKLDPQKVLDLKNNSKNKKLTFSFCEILLCGCCVSKELKIKRELYKKSNEAVSNYFEISYIISKLDELDKLQYVLLTNEQMAVFKFISKDFCSLNEYKMKNNPVNRSRSMFKDDYLMAKMYLDYKNALLTGGRIQTRIDKRLMCLLSDELKNVETGSLAMDNEKDNFGDISKL